MEFHFIELDESDSGVPTVNIEVNLNELGAIKSLLRRGCEATAFTSIYQHAIVERAEMAYDLMCARENLRYQHRSNERLLCRLEEAHALNDSLEAELRAEQRNGEELVEGIEQIVDHIREDVETLLDEPVSVHQAESFLSNVGGREVARHTIVFDPESGQISDGTELRDLLRETDPALLGEPRL